MGCSVSLEFRTKDLDKVKRIFEETGASTGSSFEKCFEEFEVQGASVYVYSDEEKYGFSSEADRMRDAGIPFIRNCGADDFDAGSIEVFNGVETEVVDTDSQGRPTVPFDLDTGKILMTRRAKRLSKLYNEVSALFEDETIDI